MPDHDLEAEMRQVLVGAGHRLELPVADAKLIRLHSNALFALPGRHVLVRVATNPDALPGVRDAVRTTRWLAGRGFPCTVPADIDNQPIVVQERVVSFWRYLPTVAEPPTTTADLGHLLRTLHDQPLPPQPPGPLVDPFASVSAAIGNASHAVLGASRRWLSSRIAALRREWAHVGFPHPPGLIHGDAHGNNLMRLSDGRVVLGDWDHVAVGPREWDLAQPHYTCRRLGYPNPPDLDVFAETYGWEVRDWPGLDTLIAIREITGLAPYIRSAAADEAVAAELAHRLTTLQLGQTTAGWTPPRRN
jgi:aminoglycoside phosphotransferase (APT) family kinase protein